MNEVRAVLFLFGLLFLNPCYGRCFMMNQDIGFQRPPLADLKNTKQKTTPKPSLHTSNINEKPEFLTNISDITPDYTIYTFTLSGYQTKTTKAIYHDDMNKFIQAIGEFTTVMKVELLKIIGFADGTINLGIKDLRTLESNCNTDSSNSKKILDPELALLRACILKSYLLPKIGNKIMISEPEGVDITNKPGDPRDRKVEVLIYVRKQ